MIRVAIDLRMAGHSGIGRYLHSLLCEMARHGGVRITGIMNPSQDAAWLPSEVEPSVLAREIPVYSLAEQVRLGRFLDEVPCDLVHVPHFNVPWVPWVPWRARAKPLVVTIHDLAYLEFSDQGRTFLHTAAARLMLRRAARRAARIVTVSEFSKGRIGDLLGEAAARKTRVIHHGAEHLPESSVAGASRHGAEHLPESSVAGASRHGAEHLPESSVAGASRDPATLLYVGNHLPHKNLPFLMEVLARLATQVPAVRLELTGQRSRHTAAVEAAARRFGVADRLKWLGGLADEGLVAAYRRSTLLVVPSLYEGFGFPALEAMALGVPVVASDAASLPEIVGEAGLLLPAGEAGLWASRIAPLLRDPLRCLEMADRGRARSGRFSWAASARSHMAVYQEVLESG